MNILNNIIGFNNNLLLHNIIIQLCMILEDVIKMGD